MNMLVSIGRSRRVAASVTLIAIDWTRPHDPRIPLGHASLMANLQSAGVPTKQLVYSATEGEGLANRIVSDVIDAGCDIVGIGAYVWNVSVVRAVVAELRRHGNTARVVIGGPEVTYAPVDELSSRFPGADLFVRGAGEDAIVGIARGELLAGVVVANEPFDGGFGRVALERLPSPFLSGVLAPEPRQRMLRWETARGCSYACSFCAHPGEPEQRRIQRRNRDDLRREIALFVEADVQRINVLDPLFNANADHAIAVLDDLIAAGVKAELTFQCRFLAMRTHTAELLDRFEKLDVELEFGIQTTDEIVGHAVRRRSERAIAEETIAELHRRGIRFNVSLIYGLPEQTLSSFEESVRWCRDRGIKRIRCYPLSLLVGTDLWNRRQELGLVEGRVPEMGDVPIVVETPWLSRADFMVARAIASGLDH